MKKLVFFVSFLIMGSSDGMLTHIKPHMTGQMSLRFFSNAVTTGINLNNDKLSDDFVKSNIAIKPTNKLPGAIKNPDLNIKGRSKTVPYIGDGAALEMLILLAVLGISMIRPASF